MKLTNKYFTIAGVIVLAILVGAVAAIFLNSPFETQQPTADMPDSQDRLSTSLPSEIETTEAEEDWGSTVEQDGILYRLNPSLQTVLFLGLDDGGSSIPGVTPGEGRRADTIFLLLLDSQKRETQLLAISRDTIADVDFYDANGEYSYTAPTHINMQYFFGDSPTRSCYLTKRAISRLLYGMRVDACLALNADAIVTIVDQLGGLTITMPGDYTDIDPKYEDGAELCLTGAETEHLLRYRDTSTHGSNEVRVERQVRLIQALVKKFQTELSVSKLEELLDSAGESLCSDLDAETLKKLISYHLNPETLTLPGSLVAGSEHDEFHVDETALRELILALYYQPVE